MLYGRHSRSGMYVCGHGRIAAKVVVIIVANFLRSSRADGKTGVTEDRYVTPSTACLTTPPALYRTLTPESRPPDGVAHVTEHPSDHMPNSPSPPLPPTPSPFKEFDVSKIWPFRKSTIRYNYTRIAASTLGPTPAPVPLTDQAYSVSVTQYECKGDWSGDRRKCRKRKPRVEIDNEHAADRFQGTNTVWPLPNYPSDTTDAGHKMHHVVVFKMPVGQLDLLYTVRRGEEQLHDDTISSSSTEDGGPCGRRR